MKFYWAVILMLLCMCFFSCDEDEMSEPDEPERITVTATFENNSGASGCGNGAGFEVTYFVTYRDVNAIFNVEEGNSAILNLLVEDGESINVRVQNVNDAMTVANSDVSVRTASRPDGLGNRRVEFCNLFDLNFINF